MIGKKISHYSVAGKPGVGGHIQSVAVSSQASQTEGDMQNSQAQLTIEAQAIYSSIRQEILDQKGCQFRMIATALTFNAAVLAYANNASVGPLVYIAPIVMNVFALAIILDKALSIQRMVGYLQLMESDHTPRQWMWEYHLNQFRGISVTNGKSDSHRHHTYVRNVALMLFFLTVLSAALYFLGPEMQELRGQPTYSSVAEIYRVVGACIGMVVGFAITLIVGRWWQLVFGAYSSDSIRQRWYAAFDESKTKLEKEALARASKTSCAA